MCDMNAKEDTIALAAKANCKGMAFGIETISYDVLKNIGKRFVSKTKAEKFVETLRKYDIYSSANYMIGYYGETRESTGATIRYATNILQTDALQFSIATPFPGTPFFKMCDENGYLITKDWTRYDGARYSVVDYPELKHNEIEAFFKYAMKNCSQLIQWDD